jgi:hypothetical protein
MKPETALVMMACHSHLDDSYQSQSTAFAFFTESPFPQFRLIVAAGSILARCTLV